MSTPTAPRRSARLLGGAAMLLLLTGVVFAPLVSALSLCAMPCCHHTPSPNASLAGNYPCPMKCTISKAPDDVAALAPQTSVQIAQVTAPLAVAVVDPAPAASSPPIVVNDHHADRPLHLVNSVFLI